MSKEQSKEKSLDSKVLLDEARQIPLADVLIDAFEKWTNPKTWELKFRTGKTILIGELKSKQGEEDKRALIIEKFSNEVRLQIFLWKDRYDNFPWGDANLVAGPLETGIRTSGSGNEFTFGIRLYFKTGCFSLPRSDTNWVLEIVSEVAHKASELHDPIYKQPRFWDNPSNP